MIRSQRISPFLSRICGDGIPMSLLVTANGELLGSHVVEDNPISLEPSDVGALVTEVAADYLQLGKELQRLDNKTIKSSNGLLPCLIVEMNEGNWIGIAGAGSDCYVVAIAEPSVPQGFLKERLLAVSQYVKESFSQIEGGL